MSDETQAPPATPKKPGRNRRAKGEGTIYGPNPQGLYVGRPPGRRPDGKKYNPVYGKSKAEVAKKLKSVAHDIEAGLQTTDKKTVGEYLDFWLTTVRVQASTLVQYRYCLDKAKETPVQVREAQDGTVEVLQRFKDVPVRNTRPEHILKVISHAEAGGNLGPTTVRLIRSILSMAFKMAADPAWGYLKTNPVLSVPRPKAKKFHPVVWTPAQVRQFFAWNSGDWRLPMIAFYLATGVRPSEAMALHVQKLNLDAGLVVIDQTCERSKGRFLRFKDVKTENAAGRRALPLPPSLIPILREHVKTLKGPLVFPTLAGTVWHLSNFNRAVKAMCRRASVPEIRPYDTRHTHGTALAAAGVHIKVITSRLGHTQMATTNRYLHTDGPEFQIEASALIEDLMFVTRPALPPGDKP